MKWTTVFITALCSLAASPLFPKEPVAPVEKAPEAASSLECFFLPPKGWEIADPKTLSPRVKIAFVKNTGGGFRPSINLAVEPTQATPSEYLRAVRAIHEQDRTNHWRALGKVHTAAGLAQLTEIDTRTECGPVRLLQLILVKEGNAWILTGAALKEEFPECYRDFQAAFRSLTLTSDLVGNIPQFDRRESLKSRQQQLCQAAQAALEASPGHSNLLEDSLFQDNCWTPFQQTILKDFSDMGAFWQVLLLRETQQKLMALQGQRGADTIAEEREESPHVASSDTIMPAGARIDETGALEQQRLQILQILTRSWPMAPGFKQFAILSTK